MPLITLTTQQISQLSQIVERAPLPYNVSHPLMVALSRTQSDAVRQSATVDSDILAAAVAASGEDDSTFMDGESTVQVGEGGDERIHQV